MAPKKHKMASTRQRIEAMWTCPQYAKIIGEKMRPKDPADPIQPIASPCGFPPPSMMWEKVEMTEQNYMSMVLGRLGLVLIQQIMIQDGMKTTWQGKGKGKGGKEGGGKKGGQEYVGRFFIGDNGDK